jgi:ABC-type branched-subunit amino acid transport system ATPase component
MVEQGQIVGLVGPNGAGKTTVFNVIAGGLCPDAGDVILDRRRITGWPAHQVARTGLRRTFQVPLLFEELSVMENLLAAVPNQAGERFWNIWFRRQQILREEQANEDHAWEVLHFLGLAPVANDLAGRLSGGQKKLLELGRVLMAKPKLLLLDEPVSGVNPGLAELIASRIVALRERGHTFLIIEHNIGFIMDLADRVCVMANGSILREGRPEDMRLDRSVLDAYLGVS